MPNFDALYVPVPDQAWTPATLDIFLVPVGLQHGLEMGLLRQFESRDQF